MKKIIFKYVIEFSVIVLGISVSFWFDKYQKSLDNIDNMLKNIEQYESKNKN